MSIFTRIYGSVARLYERRFEPERLRSLAEDYWRLLLTGSLIGLLAVVAFGAMQFIGTLEALGSASSSVATPSVALDRAQLKAILSGLDERQSQYVAAQRSSATYPDPSN